MTDIVHRPSWDGLDGYSRTVAAQEAARTGPDPAVFTQLFEPMHPLDGPLKGCVVSVKDLFDVTGYVTRAGGRRRAKNPPAPADANCVAKMRNAGAAFVGHTNMTELAYSGLGLNPHYGTPETPLFAGATAGGSSSGAAVSVARGYADLALATDTGGSARIPAAFCGLVGWKPTATRISRKGALPVSFTLDGVGLIGRSVADVTAGFAVLSPMADIGPEPVRLLLAQGFGLDHLEDGVKIAFDHALQCLRDAKLSLGAMPPKPFETYVRIPVWHFAAVEIRSLQPGDWTEANLIDPRVAERMARADDVSAISYASSLRARADFVEEMTEALGTDVLVLPTAAILPPQISQCATPEAFHRLNALALRNTALANVMDGCAISLPIGGHPGTGFMMIAARGQDERLLRLATQIERILRWNESQQRR
ncbi:amidase family protein [Bradyrhizobium barranii subsp. apii]|uniref:Amidase family protein n=1 Tax=Bradyrhizobium barranii subsp. apii TaxID=2819348 RepID=A0A8T5UYB0_9BRAD|nr:amidase family protein [Bradyrhizobium barranii]UPT86964.1 amidase family protein [Bradyrhizobium barranii subsp. apii]